MANTPDVSEFAASVLHLIQRFTGNQPDALAQMRAQVENELAAGRDAVARAEAQLAAIDQLQALVDDAGANGGADLGPLPPVNKPPLKKAVLRVLAEQPERWWHREELFAELVRRGWGPGSGDNPRNTLTSRLRDLEKEVKLLRKGDYFRSLKDEEVLAV